MYCKLLFGLQTKRIDWLINSYIQLREFQSSKIILKQLEYKYSGLQK